MPRSSDYLVEGYTYHLTHRCQNREFHLRFARDRTAYRRWLFEGVRRHHVSVYAYPVTCNHVHLVVRADDVGAVGRLMQLAAGSTAKSYNLRKGHLGSVWEHPYPMPSPNRQPQPPPPNENDLHRRKAPRSNHLQLRMLRPKNSAKTHTRQVRNVGCNTPDEACLSGNML